MMRTAVQRFGPCTLLRVIALAAAVACFSGGSAHAQCSGDLTDSGTVNVFDLLELLACWGPATLPGCEPADLNEDGMVTVFDLLELLAAWGDCPCAPNCEGATCGDDGCGGSCGECPDGSLCEKRNCTCVPDCEGRTCGDDGCGGSCGECGQFLACEDGECVSSIGACCFNNSDCWYEPEMTCSQWGGNFIGHGVECDDGTWPSVCNTCLNYCGEYNPTGNCTCVASCSNGHSSCCPDVCEQCGDLFLFAWCHD